MNSASAPGAAPGGDDRLRRDGGDLGLGPQVEAAELEDVQPGRG
jgi:hypothetical protein